MEPVSAQHPGPHCGSEKAAGWMSANLSVCERTATRAGKLSHLRVRQRERRVWKHLAQGLAQDWPLMVRSVWILQRADPPQWVYQIKYRSGLVTFISHPSFSWQFFKCGHKEAENTRLIRYDSCLQGACSGLRGEGEMSQAGGRHTERGQSE